MIVELGEEDRKRSKDTERVRGELAEKIMAFLGGQNERMTPASGLSFARVCEYTPPMSYLYEPSLSLIIRGRKRVKLGETTYIYDESRFLLTSVNLPTVTEVLQASAEAPYISLLMRLDLQMARQLMADIEQHGPHSPVKGPGMATGPATPELFDAIARLIAIFDKPRDLPHLGKLIQQEILYRILTSPAGGRLRETVLTGTRSHRTAKAITWLRENFDKPLKMAELAAFVGMGQSTLHHHFRMVTAMSPLQYQKHLRLHEARRMLIGENVDAATAAVRVGYESVTQFSREYRRMFGAPPIKDVKGLRAPVFNNPSTF